MEERDVAGTLIQYKPGGEISVNKIVKDTLEGQRGLQRSSVTDTLHIWATHVLFFWNNNTAKSRRKENRACSQMRLLCHRC